MQAQPDCPQAWLSFLQHEESLAPPGRSPAAGSGMSGLCQLFAWATRVVPRQPHASPQAYQLLWIGLARHQWFVPWQGNWSKIFGHWTQLVTGSLQPCRKVSRSAALNGLGFAAWTDCWLGRAGVS